VAQDVEIRVSGSGGQGLLLSAHILAHALILEGRKVAQSQSYEPTSRGGMSRSDLIVSDGAVDYPLATALDYLLILDEVAAKASEKLIKPDATVLVDAARVPSPPMGPFTVHSLPFTETARAVGNERAANMVALGALVEISGICGRKSLEQAIRTDTPAKFLELNLEALRKGYGLIPAPTDAPASA
jgi:2-oxoglutarate ferredoxin oxidoreductase subunit gamma